MLFVESSAIPYGRFIATLDPVRLGKGKKEPDACTPVPTIVDSAPVDKITFRMTWFPFSAK